MTAREVDELGSGVDVELVGLMVQCLAHDHAGVLRSSVANLDRAIADGALGDADLEGLLGAVRDDLAALEGNLAGLMADLAADPGDRLAGDRGVLDVGALVQDVVAGITERGGHEVTVHVAGPAHAHVHPWLVQRAVGNLVRNALRHTPMGTVVTVSVSRAEDMVRVVVEDDGPGVDDAYKATIFDPFERGNAPSWQAGVGLGLALVRGVALEHGGRVVVEDRPGGGARFVLDLPRSTAADQGRESPAA